MIEFPRTPVNEQAFRDEVQLAALAAYELLQRTNPDEASSVLAMRISPSQMPLLVVSLPKGWKVRMVPEGDRVALWVCRP